MTTAATKTRALCVATRCTSVDQFVATFHRFCGDDSSFFVATLTSRPVGLETPFSIQLADKQPVLRGLCIVLDAWATPENRYKRPGIRLGIKRLTAESQLVFERLRAAARSSAPSVRVSSPSIGIAEATPAPGLPPLPPAVMPPPAMPLPPLPPVGAAPLVSPLGAVPPVPLVPRPPSAQPPPLPPSLPPRPPKMSIPSVRPAEPAAKPAEPVAAKLEPVAAKPPEPVAAKPAEIATAKPAGIAIAKPAEPVVAAPEPVLPVPPLPAPPPPTPIEVTRFQVALHVGTTPPPIANVEFKPKQVGQRLRIRPRITTDAPPIVTKIPPDPTEAVPAHEPALIVDSPPVSPAPPLLPAPVQLAPVLPTPPLPTPPAQPASAAAATAGVATRTPGSSLVLPANPLQDLTDESIEGFVDCTLYEEVENVFHPGQGGVDANAFDLSDTASAPDAGSTVPAMPFDAAPDLTVRAVGNTVSLAVTAVDAAARPMRGAVTGAHGVIAGEAPIGESRIEVVPIGDSVVVESLLVHPDDPPPVQVRPLQLPAAAPMAPYGAFAHEPLYPAAEPANDPRLSAMQLVGLPPPIAVGASPLWQRVLLIGGTAVVAIVLAFAVARYVRGPAHAAPTESPPASALPTPKAAPVAAPRKASAAKPPEAQEQTVDGDGATDPPDDDGDAASGSAPTVGSGPCRITVATTPAASLVKLDDQPVGPSPLTIESSCDKHKVEVSHVRYQPVQRWLTPAAGKPEALDISLPRPIHSVSVTSVPPGAELLIDGHHAGTTPTVIQLMGFATVTLTFTKPGFPTVTRKVYSKQPQDRVSVKLAK